MSRPGSVARSAATDFLGEKLSPEAVPADEQRSEPSTVRANGWPGFVIRCTKSPVAGRREYEVAVSSRRTLILVGAIVVDADGAIWLSINTIPSGADGQIVKITP